MRRRVGTPRLALAVVRLAARLAPERWQERVRREWEAELLAEARRGEDDGSLIRIALGALADVRALRAIEKHESPSGGSETMIGFLAGVIRDARVALRSLLRAPAYTGVAVVTLGLGLGGTAAIYTVLDRVVLDPLPYPEPERIVRLMNQVPGVAPGERWHMSTAQYVYFGDHSETLDAVGLYLIGGGNASGRSGPERVRTAMVTAEVMSMLGARAQLGRLLSADDNAPGAPWVVVLSHEFWKRSLEADPGVIGSSLTLDDYPREVVGVLEPGVELPEGSASRATDLWLPLSVNRAGPFGNSHVFRSLGRLADGVDPASSEAELVRLTARFPEVFPNAYTESFFERYGFRTEVIPLKQSVVGEAAQNLWIVFGAVGLVLLISCANVANLFLVRTEARRRELAVRSALGAVRAQIARFMLAEGLVLAGSGALLALAVSRWAIPAVIALAPDRLPRMDGIRLDAGTVVFTVLLALLVGLGLALQPLLDHWRAGSSAGLAERSRRGARGRAGSRFRSVLVATQVAIAFVLVSSAGLLAASMRRLTSVDPGFEPAGVLTAQINLTQARYRTDLDLWRFYSQALEHVRAIPGVLAAGLSQELPLQGGFGCTVQGFEDAAVAERSKVAGTTLCAGQEPTSPGYFEAMGIPVLSGRVFETGDIDDPSRAAVVVSQAFAARFWPDEDPIGKGLAPGGRNEPPFYRVVGVVGDVPAETVSGAPAIAVYYPLVKDPNTPQGWNWWWPGTQFLVVKTAGEDPTALLPSIREAIAAVDPTVPLTNVQDMNAVVAASMSTQTFASLLLAVAAGTALLLAAVGLYGVVSYVVARRTREIGMRLAIGAKPGQVEWMVVGETLGLAGSGLVVGLVVAWGTTRVLTSLLYGVEPTEPAAFVAAAAALIGVTVLASWIPARRAARVDPTEALRSD